MQKIKLLTTDEKMNVNTKGVAVYKTRNCANLALTANYHDVIKLDQDDRRACIIKWEPQSIEVDFRGNQHYWANYVSWMENGGSEALYQFLLEWDWKTTGFDPFAWAPYTEWKKDVTDAAMDPVEGFVADLKEFTDDALGPLAGRRALWTAKELAARYWHTSEDELTPGRVKLFSNALKNGGFVLAAGGAPLRPNGRDGMQSRFFVIKDRGNMKKWSVSRECLDHLGETYVGVSGDPKKSKY